MSNFATGVQREERQVLPIQAGTAFTAQTGDPNCAIRQGDFCWFDGTTVQPASAFSAVGNPGNGAATPAALRRLFKQYYCGVAGDSQFLDMPARDFMVQTYAEVNAGCAAATFALDDSVGVADDGAGNLLNQTLVNMGNLVDQAIGRTIRVVTSTTTAAFAAVQAGQIGAYNQRGVEMETKFVADGIVLSSTTAIIATVTASNLFGCAVELISIGAITGSTMSTYSTTVTLSPCTTTLVIPANTARGVEVVQSLAADPNRVVTSETTITLQASATNLTNMTAGVVSNWVIRYRPLA